MVKTCLSKWTVSSLKAIGELEGHKNSMFSMKFTDVENKFLKFCMRTDGSYTGGEHSIVLIQSSQTIMLYT